MGGLQALSSGALQGRAPGEAAVGRSRVSAGQARALWGLYPTVTSLRYGQVGEGFRKARRQSSNPAPACCAIIPRGTPPWRACHAPGTFPAANSPLSTHQSLLPGCLRLGSLLRNGQAAHRPLRSPAALRRRPGEFVGPETGHQGREHARSGVPSGRPAPAAAGAQGPWLACCPACQAPQGQQRAACSPQAGLGRHARHPPAVSAPPPLPGRRAPPPPLSAPRVLLPERV